MRDPLDASGLWLRRRARLAGLFAAAALLVGSIVCPAKVAGTAASNGIAPVPALFRKALQDIKRKTDIPVLLPQELPTAAHASSIKHVAADADAKQYNIGLYVSAGESNATFVGYLAGEKAAHDDDNFGEKVDLANGLVGHFSARSCGGSCAPSHIQWWQRGILYTLQLRLDTADAGKERRDMIEAANSAIANGTR